MKNSVILSIVIPVYNVESYIFNTLSSIYMQEIDEELFEVIVVDDGSTDQSPSIIKQFESRHTNLTVHTQDNGGVSKARNAALDLCKGVFVTFVDGDDEIGDGSIGRIFAEIQHPPMFDILYCKSKQIVNGQSQISKTRMWEQHFEEKTIYHPDDLYRRNYKNGGSVWGGCIGLNTSENTTSGLVKTLLMEKI